MPHKREQPPDEYDELMRKILLEQSPAETAENLRSSVFIVLKQHSNPELATITEQLPAGLSLDQLIERLDRLSRYYQTQIDELDQAGTSFSGGENYDPVLDDPRFNNRLRRSIYTDAKQTIENELFWVLPDVRQRIAGILATNDDRASFLRKLFARYFGRKPST